MYLNVPAALYEVCKALVNQILSGSSIFIGLWEHVWQECVLYVSFVQESKRLIHYVMTVSLWLTDSLSYTHSHSVWGREVLHNVFCLWTRLTGGAASVILCDFVVKSWILEALNQRVWFSLLHGVTLFLFLQFGQN